MGVTSRLPYTDSEIGDAFGAVIALLMIGFEKIMTGDAQEKLFSQCFGASMHVGFMNDDSSASRGLVTRESLRGSLRPDIMELIVPRFTELAGDVRELFRIIYNPRLMFDFEAFKSTFARQVIPSQAVLQRSPILFNPARLITFGIP